ncbi:putative mucin/carbohydrate-binding domain-containing protein [Listeria riparia]|uniref:Putative enhancing factor (Viral) n=1 Tax=Listeria riparia FSL S10-1204 TaxID=1265816 RepID=W7DHA2_9LIST|nr:putative mucin/carbohydrate-binding domain-containing protein [Listeria riparia]EUJ46871.1 putative enhancing factor (viral) [Listeria riparia FSL S10-1204]
MRKIIGMCVLMLVLVGVYSYRSDVRAEEVVTKELYTLVKPVALDKAGLSRGIYYDRQDLGIIMPAGEELEIRQVDPNYSLPEAQKQASVEQYQEILPPLLDTTAETTDFVGNYFRFLLLGLGDNKFASIDLDLANNKAKLWVSDEDPHAYFADAYATMQLKDEFGNVIYAQDYIGNISNPAELNKTFAVESGYYISVMHREANTRLKMKNTESDETIPSQIENHFKITATGLQSIKKEDIPKPTENQLKYYGDQYDFSFYGLGDNKFASMDLDLVKGQAKLWVSGEEPHDYFADAYATMQLKDELGNVIYAQDYIGNISNPAELNKTFAVEPGYYISVMHREANTRLKMKNTESNETIPSQIENHFKITATGLQNVKKEDIPKPTENQLKYYGDQYDFSLYGLGDNKFASMDLDLVKGQVKLWVSDEEPHVYFQDSYATIKIEDATGNVIFAKDFLGNVANTELNETLPIESGSLITIMHREAASRLVIQDVSVGSKLLVKETVTYQVTSTGLRLITSK